MRPHDGLHQFKASFGGAELPYYYVTVIADRQKYNQLVAAENPEWPYAGASQWDAPCPSPR
jgi:hypothetical protein